MGALLSSLAFTLYTLHKKNNKYAFLFAISKKKQYLCGAI